MLYSILPHKKSHWKEWVRNPSGIRRTKARRMELPNHTCWLPPRFFPNPPKSSPWWKLLYNCPAAAEINDVINTSKIYKKNAKQWIKHCCLGEDCCVGQKKSQYAYVSVTAWSNLDKNKKFWKAKSKEEIKIRKRKYIVDVAISASFWKKNQNDKLKLNWNVVQLILWYLLLP